MNKEFKIEDWSNGEGDSNYWTGLLNPWIDKLSNPEAFWDWYDLIVKNENIVSSGPQGGYIRINVDVAKMIPKDKIVIDAGCGFGWQQVLYQKHAKYIGINHFFNGHNVFNGEKVELKPMFPTTYFYQGLFHEIIDEVMEKHNLKYDDDNVVAISVASFFMSQHGGSQANANRDKFNQFRNKIIVR